MSSAKVNIRSSLCKARAAFKLGGLNLILFKAEDKIFGTKNSADYLYKIYKAASPNEYPKLVQERMIMRSGVPFDITKPRTFNEKIQWLKAFDSTPVKTKLADKYLVREWIAEKIGPDYLVPLLGVWDRFDDIDFATLPNKFVLKCNHGSGWNIIVDDKFKLNLNDARSSFEQWMKTNYAFKTGEFQYKDIPPKIIAEKYLECTGGLKDYRFYCFNGEPIQIWVDKYSGTPKHIRCIFDLNWDKLDFKCTWPDGREELTEKPHFFDEMVRLSKILCKDFYFVRVDFFEVENQLYMGEMTFTPMNGYGVFDPLEWDNILGDYLKLPI